MKFPLVRDLATDGIPAVVTCRVLGFSPQAFYKWRAQPVSDREWSDAHLIDAAREIHADDPEFGYRFSSATAESTSRTCSGLGEMPPTGAWIVVGGLRIRRGSGSPATVFGLVP